MNSLKRILFTLVCLLLSSEIASAANAEDLLLRDLAPAIKKFEKEIQVYHYFYAPTQKSESDITEPHPFLTQISTRTDWIQFLIKSRTSPFWDLNNTNSDYVNAGPGMYFAIDPHSSKEFGDTAVVMRIPQDMKFISVYGSTKLGTDTINALISEGVIKKNQLLETANGLGLQKGFSSLALKNMVKPENIEWRKFIINLFTKENIQFVEYWYKSHLAGFCKKADQAAFVYIGSNPELSAEIVPSLETMLYSKFDLKEYSPEESRKIDLLNRFKNILDAIRIKGVGTAKKLIFENLTVDEMNELAADSYKCTRRHQ